MIKDDGGDQHGQDSSPKTNSLELRNFPLLHLESAAEVLVSVPDAGDVSTN